MFNHKIATLISEYFYCIDVICRKDLFEKRLTTERDYVSRLMTHAMYPLGPATPNELIFWISQTLPYNAEVRFGCDVAIIFKSGNEVKIGMFEAKFPRLNKSTDDWDRKNTHRNSRFTSQLERQNRWNNDVVIWEMFFNDKKVGTTFEKYDKFGSSCVWHNYAYKHKPKTKTWKKRDIDTIFSDRDKHKSAKNIKEILYQILICNKGQKKPIVNDQITIVNSEDRSQQNIPIYNDMISYESFSGKDNFEKIEEFMNKAGLKDYILLDLDTLNNKETEKKFIEISQLLKKRIDETFQ